MSNFYLTSNYMEAFPSKSFTFKKYQLMIHNFILPLVLLSSALQARVIFGNITMLS